jgi:hypothetical protein
MQSNVYNYHNRTNNSEESINQKLKKVISKFSNIVTFLEDLMRVVSSLRMERDHKAIVVFQKVKVRITTYYLLKSPRSDGLHTTSYFVCVWLCDKAI